MLPSCQLRRYQIDHWHPEHVPLCSRDIQKTSYECPQDCQKHIGGYSMDVQLRSNGTILRNNPKDRTSFVYYFRALRYCTGYSSNRSVPLIVDTRYIAINIAALDTWCTLQPQIQNMTLCAIVWHSQASCILRQSKMLQNIARVQAYLNFSHIYFSAVPISNVSLASNHYYY